MTALRATWRHYYRGLMAEAAADVPSASLESKAAMSKTKGHNDRKVSGARKERKRKGTRQAKLLDIPPGARKTAPTVDLCVDAGAELLSFAQGRRFATILADPPWQFTNKTGKVAPEHKRLSRYGTMKLDEIMALPIGELVAPTAHLYLWCPNALLPEGLAVMKAWGFTYKANIVWHKIRKDGGSDGRGVGFYFRNVTELILFGVRGKNARTLAPGRRQVNLLATRKREHSRKPDEQYGIIEACSAEPYLELFARGKREGWVTWGNQASEDYRPTWKTYAHHSQAGLIPAE